MLNMIDWWKFNPDKFGWWQNKCCYVPYVNHPFLVMHDDKIKVVTLIVIDEIYYFAEEKSKLYNINNHPYSHYALVNLPCNTK